MKRIMILGLSLLTTLILLAQRGRIRPEDLGSDTEESFATSTNYVGMFFMIIIIIVIVIAVIMIRGSIERNKPNKRYRAKCNIHAYFSVRDYVDDNYSSDNLSPNSRYIKTILVKEGDECYIQRKAVNNLCYAYFDKHGLLVVPLKDLERI